MSSPNSVWPEGRKRIVFDPVINAGHVMTALVTLVSAFGAILAMWNSVQAQLATNDKRLSLVENRVQSTAQLQEARDASQDVLVRESIVGIRESIADLKRSLDNRKER